MTLQRLIEITGAENVTPELPMSTEVSCGYTCDLLSWVMAHGKKGMDRIEDLQDIRAEALYNILFLAL